jgi:ferredoxin--NADP+ reductase
MRGRGAAADLEDGRNAIMAYVITDACIKDGLCIETCPTECIHPTKEEAQYETVTQLYINQEECLDCGACQSSCESNAIFPGDQVPEGKEDSAEKNAAYFASLSA